ncbi:hypothetical protein DSO57_1001045 [Entomophthora muscae]|uniref:Uncharacterized protein n=1 Tax=Entomophthora muscae TaxID=34485 RepID=A0ACC2UUL4_9FUNG|nr:hypothetical protein DSO57_1001045 [Entomophthora muscae]
MPTIGSLIPAFTPYNITSIGPFHPLSADSTLPTISGPPLEENISDYPVILTDMAISFQAQLDPLSVGPLSLRQDSNPEPEFLQAAGPMDQEPAHLRFSEIEPPQAKAPAKS